LSNRRRGIQDTSLRNKTIDWVSGGGGQNYRNRNIGQNYKAKGGYRTIGSCIGWDYKKYSKGDRCLEGYEIFSFHFL